MSDRIGPLKGGESKSEKIKSPSSKKAFQDALDEVDRVDEAYLDQPRKKPTPYQAEFHQTPSSEEAIPQSPGFYEEEPIYGSQSQQIKRSDESKETQPSDETSTKDKKVAEKKKEKLEKKELQDFGKGKVEGKQGKAGDFSTKKKPKIGEAAKEAEVTSIPGSDIKMGKIEKAAKPEELQLEEKQAPSPTEAKVSKRKMTTEPSIFGKAEYISRENPFVKKERRPGEEQLSKGVNLPPPTQIVIDPQIAQHVEIVSAHISPYLSDNIVPLFQSMVGTMLQMSKDGISQTQITLNAPNFAHSVFFNAKILFDRYATAPDSFNITLRTPDSRALTLFNDNLGQLVDGFKNGNLPFRLGRMHAEYETTKRIASIHEEEEETRE